MENLSYFLNEHDYTMYNPEDIENINTTYFLMALIFNITYLSIACILGIIGNVLVIWIAGFKMNKTVNIIWFLNLAIADFVFVMTFPFEITEMLMDGHWPFGQIMCKVKSTIFFLNMSVSTSFLMIISIDRCISILCPVWSKNHRSPKLALIISAIKWLICFMLSSPYFVFFDILNDSEYSILYCIPLYADDDYTDIMRDYTMKIIRFVSMFLVPFSVIVTCYGLIAFRIRRSRSLSRSDRPLKVIITIVVCFFCFWFPYHTWPLLEDLNFEMNNTLFMIISSVAYHLGFFNSCINPIVYVFVGKDFKKSLFRSIPLHLENTLKE